MDDERLKKGGMVLGRDYFEELLERIREIRSSERRFYQKVTDIYALSVDYDRKAPITREFFATVQNKLHWGSPVRPPQSRSTGRRMRQRSTWV